MSSNVSFIKNEVDGYVYRKTLKGMIWDVISDLAADTCDEGGGEGGAMRV